MIARLLIFLYDGIFGKSGIILLIIFLSYKYGYPAYQKYEISKLEQSVKENIKQNLIDYDIQLDLHQIFASIQYENMGYSIDTSQYPKVAINYTMKNYEDNNFPDAYHILLSGDCGFFYRLFQDRNRQKAIAIQNVLIMDKVIFYHEFRNKYNNQILVKSFPAAACFKDRELL